MEKYELLKYDLSKIMTKDFCRRIMFQIDYDLGNGVFDSFPKVKRRFEIIYIKLQKMVFIINAEGLNNDDLILIIENDYIKL